MRARFDHSCSTPKWKHAFCEVRKEGQPAAVPEGIGRSVQVSLHMDYVSTSGVKGFGQRGPLVLDYRSVTNLGEHAMTVFKNRLLENVKLYVCERLL